MADQRRRQWVAMDVFLLDSPLGVGIREKFGPAGLILFHAYLYACKRNSVQGQISYSSEADALALMSLPGLALTNERGETWALETFWRFLGHHKVIRRRRRGRLTDVLATKWGKWQQTPPRGGGGGEKPTSEAGFTDEIQTENAENGNGLGRIDRDNDNDSDKDIQKPSSGKPDPSLFASFWSAYPRHVAKAAAEKAWAKIVKTIDPLTIVVGAERMAADPNLPAEQFIPHPATWLNQQRWNDPPYPSATGRAPQANTRDAGKLALLQGLRAGA
jgi:hypothetical protein